MEIDNAIREFLAENFLYGNKDGLPGDDDSFMEKGFIDSTGILEVVSFIEEKYLITIEDDDLIPENFDSINRLVNFITSKRKTNV